MRLSFVAVTTDQQFRDLLLVRNECRDGLTHDTHELTLEDQKGFRTKCWGENLWYEPYLLYDEGWPVGYGLLKWDGKRYWMTAGLVKEYRGQGLSRLLITYITEIAYREKRNVEVWLDAYDENTGMFGYIRQGYEFPEVWIDVVDNNPALFGDIRSGYEFVRKGIFKHDQTLHVMKHNRERRLRKQEAEWMRDHGRQVPEWSISEDIAQEMIEVDEISRSYTNV